MNDTTTTPNGRCADHPAYEADYCPACGTARVIGSTPVPTMIEASCVRCGETFIPADANDLTHLVTADGDECGGHGIVSGWLA